MGPGFERSVPIGCLRQRCPTQRLVQRHERKAVRQPRLFPVEFRFTEREFRVCQLQAVGLAQALQLFAER